MLLLWLKFVVMWRFFRLWAFADGVVVQENLTRFVYLNRNITGFWRHWHVSFNKWLISYIYIPLGGRSTRVWNVWLIFAFTALWHEVEPQILAWASLNAGLIFVEMALDSAWRKPAVMRLPAYARRHVRVWMAIGPAYLIILVNFVGWARHKKYK